MNRALLTLLSTAYFLAALVAGAAAVATVTLYDRPPLSQGFGFSTAPPLHVAALFVLISLSGVFNGVASIRKLRDARAPAADLI